MDTHYTSRYSITLPKTLVRNLDRYCRRNHIHRGHLIAELISKFLHPELPHLADPNDAGTLTKETKR